MANDSEPDKNARKPTAEQIQAAKMAKDELKALGDLATRTEPKGLDSLPRLCRPGRDDDEAVPKVVIFQSGEVEKPKTGGTKKNPKGKQAKGTQATPDRTRTSWQLQVKRDSLALILLLPLSTATAQPPAGPEGKTVEQWAEQLNSEEFRQQWHAAYVLGTLGPQAAPAVPALHAVLDVKSGKQRIRPEHGRLGPGTHRPRRRAGDPFLDRNDAHDEALSPCAAAPRRPWAISVRRQNRP